MTHALRHAMSDAAFDGVLPKEFRHLSAVHWTPYSVALRAAEWLAPEPTTRVLDVGSGVGKLCVIGAMSTGAEWHGVERHRPAVVAAVEAAQRFGVSHRTHFVHGDALSIGWTEFDSFYFYNPFDIFDNHVGEIVERLAWLRPGTRVVTFHGLGDDMPACYQRIQRENIELGDLELWIRGESR